MPEDKTRNRPQRVFVATESEYNIFYEPSRIKIPDVQVPRKLKVILEKSSQEIMLLDEENNKYLDLVQSLLTKTKVSPSMHLEMLRTLLFIEQHNQDEEMEKHAMKDQRVTQCSNPKMFKVNVPTINEDDPFLNLGDFVLLRKSSVPESKLHFLKIVEVGNVYVKAKTDKDPAWFENENYDVQFKVNNYPMQCFQFTLDRIQESSMTSLFFPVPKAVCNKVKEITESSAWFNKRISGNMEQRRAVEHIISQTAKPAPYILFGPPGTGKTATLVEAVLQIWSSDPANRILICTPSNAAADEVTRRILQFDIPHYDVMRYYSPSRDSSIDKKILPSSNFVHEVGITLPKDIILSKKIVITTLTSSMRLIKLGLRETHFSYIFIDEAGQAHEPETLIPYGLTKYLKKSANCQIVFAGDPKQLGPVIKSKIAEPLLGISMLERLMSLDPYKRDRNNKYDPNYIIKLINNFRSHEAILKVPNELFYENELVACGGMPIKLAEYWKCLPRKKFPIIFHAVDGSEYGERGNPSTCNEDEIAVVIHYIRKLIYSKISKVNNIGIVTPFKLQERKIKEKLQKMGKADINVGTVQVFQGQEKEVIIMTTVRSRLLEHEGETHIGFLSNAKRFNVSITRARALLIVIGNPNVLKFDPNWRQFISHCKVNGACTGITVNPEELTTDEMNYLLDRKKIMVKKKWQKKVETPLMVYGTRDERNAILASQDNRQSKILRSPEPTEQADIKTNNYTDELTRTFDAFVDSSLSTEMSQPTLMGKNDSRVSAFVNSSWSTEKSQPTVMKKKDSRVSAFVNSSLSTKMLNPAVTEDKDSRVFALANSSLSTQTLNPAVVDEKDSAVSAFVNSSSSTSMSKPTMMEENDSRIFAFANSPLSTEIYSSRSRPTMMEERNSRIRALMNSSLSTEIFNSTAMEERNSPIFALVNSSLSTEMSQPMEKKDSQVSAFVNSSLSTKMLNPAVTEEKDSRVFALANSSLSTQMLNPAVVDEKDSAVSAFVNSSSSTSMSKPTLMEEKDSGVSDPNSLYTEDLKTTTSCWRCFLFWKK